MTGTEGIWVAAIVSTVATAASTGVAMYSADQQAKSQAAIADYNRQINEQNASWQRMAAERAAQSEQYNSQLAIFNAQSQQSQAAFQSQISTYQNEQLRQQSQFSDMQAQMQRNAADQMRQQADGQDRQAKDQADRIRAEKNRILGLQRSQFAKGGVTTEGSPLAVLADTANLYEMQVADTRLLANLESNKKRYEADVTDFNAGITALEGGMMRDQAKINESAIGFNLNQDLFTAGRNLDSARMSFNDAQFAEKAAGAGYRIAMRQAAIEQQAGMATSRATQLGGYAAGAAGVAQMGQIGMSAYGSSASKSTAKPYDGYVSNNGNLVGYRRATAVS
jgi:hypothetical protein